MRLIKQTVTDKVIKCADGVDRPATNYFIEFPLGNSYIRVLVKPVFKDGYRTFDAFAEPADKNESAE